MSNPLGLVGYGGRDDDDIGDVDSDVSASEASEAPSPHKEGEVADTGQEVEAVPGPSTSQGMME
jgi:hypothetical protein